MKRFKLDDKSYHAIKDRLSNSAIKAYDELRNPKRWWIEHNTPQKSTDAMNKGSVVHLMVLQPEEIKKQVRIKTPYAKDTDPNFIHVTEKMFDECQLMARKVLTHHIASELIQSSHKEDTLFWELNNIPFKGKADLISQDFSFIADLKTTQSAHPLNFQQSITNYRYDIQAAIYIDALTLIESLDKQPKFYFICVESKPPFSVNVIECGSSFVEIGRTGGNKVRGYHDITLEIAQFWPLPHDQWPEGDNTHITTLEAPEWL